jgi:hypothetical protein
MLLLGAMAVKNVGRTAKSVAAADIAAPTDLVQLTGRADLG